MKNEEIKIILNFIFAGFTKPSKLLVQKWRSVLVDIDYKQAQAAARILATKKVYGQPTIADFFECLSSIDQSANLPAEQALQITLQVIKRFGHQPGYNTTQRINALNKYPKLRSFLAQTGFLQDLAIAEIGKPSDIVKHRFINAWREFSEHAAQQRLNSTLQITTQQQSAQLLNQVGIECEQKQGLTTIKKQSLQD